jgi:hypothetical protein
MIKMMEELKVRKKKMRMKTQITIIWMSMEEIISM